MCLLKIAAANFRDVRAGRQPLQDQAPIFLLRVAEAQGLPIPTTDAATRDGKRQASELSARISGLYGAVARYTGAPTSDQRSELRFYKRMAAELEKAGR